MGYRYRGPMARSFLISSTRWRMSLLKRMTWIVGGLSVRFAPSQHHPGRRWRIDRIGGTDQTSRLVDQKPALPFVILSTGLLGQCNGAAAVGVGSNGFLINGQTHVPWAQNLMRFVLARSWLGTCRQI